MMQRFDSGNLLTLGQALQSFRASTGEDDATEQMADLAEVFERHDAIHVLFDCGTSIQDEIAVHVWMAFATTAKVSEMHRAVSQLEHRNVLSGIGHFKLIGIWVRCLPRILSIILKSLRMKKRVAIEELSELKPQPVFDIRLEHGIVL